MASLFEATLAQLTLQHKQFLAEVDRVAVATMKAENGRLTREVAELKDALRSSTAGGSRPGHRQAKVREPPLPPPMPPPRPTSEPVCLAVERVSSLTKNRSTCGPREAARRGSPPSQCTDSTTTSSPRELPGSVLNAGCDLETAASFAAADDISSSDDEAMPHHSVARMPEAAASLSLTVPKRAKKKGRVSMLLPVGSTDTDLATSKCSTNNRGSLRLPADSSECLRAGISDEDLPMSRCSTNNRGSIAAATPNDERKRTKELRRLWNLLKLESQFQKRGSSIVTGKAPPPNCNIKADYLAKVLNDRDSELFITVESVTLVVQAFRAATKACGFENEFVELPLNQVSLNTLVDIIWMPNLEDFIDHDALADVSVVIAALRMSTPEEIVYEASRACFNQNVANGPHVATKRTFKWYLNMWVSIVVVVNMVSMGVSVDNSPNSLMWFGLEVCCTFTYVFEMCYNIHLYGLRGFLTGENSSWNIADTIITILSMLEMGLEIATRLSIELGSGEQVASATRATVMLRALRAVRVVRLIKLVRSAMLRDLANMLVGFVIGIPSLLWVLFMFVLILCLFGMFSRLMFGPSAERMPGHWTSKCGLGDDMSNFNDLECPVHYLYGEEFFGTVGKSMFTCFRFMLGDYSTRGGKSLVVAMSQDYGSIFDLVFVAWMIVVIFGIFNIITAIFVDTTVAGLKHNDVRRKHAQQYERSYVRKKLTEFLGRVQAMDREGELELDVANSGRVELTESQFLALAEDPMARSLLQDLDVEVSNLPQMFSTFDGDDRGSVGLQEIVEGIMKLRGEPQKTDVIGCWVSTRMLHDKVDALTGMLEAQVLEAIGRQSIGRPSAVMPQRRTTGKVDRRSMALG